MPGMKTSWMVSWWLMSALRRCALPTLLPVGRGDAQKRHLARELVDNVAERPRVLPVESTLGDEKHWLCGVQCEGGSSEDVVRGQTGRTRVSVVKQNSVVVEVINDVAQLSAFVGEEVGVGQHGTAYPVSMWAC